MNASIIRIGPTTTAAPISHVVPVAIARPKNTAAAANDALRTRSQRCCSRTLGAVARSTSTARDADLGKEGCATVVVIAPTLVERPREESNLRTQLRRLPLCPLSYGADGWRRGL